MGLGGKQDVLRLATYLKKSNLVLNAVPRRNCDKRLKKLAK
jgi:hypothetical protein